MMCVCANLLQSYLTSQSHKLQPARFLCPRDAPGKKTGVGCHALLPRDLPDPGTELESLLTPALAGGFFTIVPPLTHNLPRWLSDKESAYNAGGASSISGSGRGPGEGNGNPPQYSCLANFMDREAWWARGPQESDTTYRLSTHACIVQVIFERF